MAKEFLKIEKVEFGGPKGKVLGANISAVYRYVIIVQLLDSSVYVDVERE